METTCRSPCITWDFPSGASGKEPNQCRRCKRRSFHPWLGKIPWRRKWQPIPVFLSGESQGQRNLAGYSLAGYSPWGHKECKATEQLKTQHMYYVEMGCISPGPPHPQQRNDFASSYFPTTGLPRWLSGKEFACNAGDAGSIPGL